MVFYISMNLDPTTDWPMLLWICHYRCQFQMDRMVFLVMLQIKPVEKSWLESSSMKVWLTSNDCDIEIYCKNQNNSKHFIRFDRNERLVPEQMRQLCIEYIFSFVCVFLNSARCIFYLSNKMKLDQTEIDYSKTGYVCIDFYND